MKMNTNCVVFPSPGRTTGVAHPFNAGSGWEDIAVYVHSDGSMVGFLSHKLDNLT